MKSTWNSSARRILRPLRRRIMLRFRMPIQRYVCSSQNRSRANRARSLAFLPTLERQERKADRTEIKERIRAAEQAGDLAEAMRLMEELNRAESG